MVTVEEIEHVSKLMKIDVDDHSEYLEKVQTMISYFDILDSAGVESEEISMPEIPIEQLRNDEYIPFNEKLIVNDFGLATDLLIGFDSGDYAIEYFLNDADYYVGFKDECKYIVSIGGTAGSKYYCSKDSNSPIYSLDVKKYNSIFLVKDRYGFSAIGVEE